MVHKNFLIKYPKQGEVFLSVINRVITEYFHIPKKAMFSKTRKKEIVRPRQIAMALSMKMTTCSLNTVGLYFGNKDHATVYHSCNKVNEFCDTDREYRGQYMCLYIKLSNLINENEESLYVCSICGNSELIAKRKTYIDVNTLEVIKDVKFQKNDFAFCNKCHIKIQIVPIEKYILLDKNKFENKKRFSLILKTNFRQYGPMTKEEEITYLEKELNL